MVNRIVSIIIPTYNRAHYLIETLDCVLVQTYTNWECIIVDDGSTDNTELIVNKYIKIDNRFKYIKRPLSRTKGASVCRNIGIENSIGNYIQFLDSDDLISSNKLELQLKALMNFPENTIATCKWGRFKKEMNDSVNFDNLDSYNNFDNIEFFLDALSNSKGYFPIHAYLISRKIINISGGWNEYLSLNDDSEFLMRLFCNTHQICFVEEATAYYRWTGSSNVSSYNNYQKVNDAINSWKMIEANLLIRFKEKKNLYIENMKEGLYVNVKNSFPKLITEHRNFFIKQIKLNNRYNSVKRYFYQLFYKLWKIVR